MPVAAVAAFLSAASATPAAADVFAEQTPLNVTLTAPFQAAFRTREDPEYQPATLEIGAADGAKTTVPLRIRVRGKSRAVACGFPPLLLNFRTPDLANTILEGEDRLKLVTHCDSRSSYDNYVMLEYLAYRVLNLLTPHSLRPRLVRVTYFDSERRRDLGTRPGILLEDEERFAERHGFTLFEGPTVERDRYDPAAAVLIDVFQYFLGNTDWSSIAGPSGENCCHNVVPYVRGDGLFVPVPYDFDSTGLVGVPYAVPNERLPIRNVRQRLYRGVCRPESELAPVFARFEELKPEITALFDASQGLEASAAQRARAYVEEFYDVLADDERRQKAFFAGCGR